MGPICHFIPSLFCDCLRIGRKSAKTVEGSLIERTRLDRRNKSGSFLPPERILNSFPPLHWSENGAGKRRSNGFTFHSIWSSVGEFFLSSFILTSIKTFLFTREREKSLERGEKLQSFCSKKNYRTKVFYTLNNGSEFLHFCISG